MAADESDKLAALGEDCADPYLKISSMLHEIAVRVEALPDHEHEPDAGGACEYCGCMVTKVIGPVTLHRHVAADGSVRFVSVPGDGS
jgi:hypothetical protein